MIDKFQRPLVLGSATLALTIGLLELINQTVGEWGIYALFAGAVSLGVWWVQRPSRSSTKVVPPLQYVDSTVVKKTLTEAEQIIGQLKTEANEAASLAAVEPQITLFQ